eukprot:TRINITY_DN55723_c0_g1_i1.p1 TRINITY_DN55723_c0_g1~~TRINITY_DN55723_c0_g1_i1.p1  ORF type:complete len:383 (+),score=41.78 TRINITY_DN55723_c0_g1_i1:54-1202(+)
MVFADVLKELPHGSTVAVITMMGSCCPVTLAHIQAFVEARRLLTGDAGGFTEAVGALNLNSDDHVRRKLDAKGLPFISKRDRLNLVRLAANEHPWMEANSTASSEFVDMLVRTWPQLDFTRVSMNGADDVIAYRKWRLPHRQIVMCRPGTTAELMARLHADNVNTTDGQFIVGPELPDISSTEVRSALFQGDRVRLLQLLHADVANWCWDHGPYRPPSHSSGKIALGTRDEATAISVLQVRRPAESGCHKTTLRQNATRDRSDDAWAEGRPTVKNGDVVEELKREGAFSWIRVPCSRKEGFVQRVYLHGDGSACVQRTDDIAKTLLRKHPTSSRSDDAYVEPHVSVSNGEQIRLVCCESDFTWVRTASGGEGFIRSEYLFFP